MQPMHAMREALNEIAGQGEHNFSYVAHAWRFYSKEERGSYPQLEKCINLWPELIEVSWKPCGAPKQLQPHVTVKDRLHFHSTVKKVDSTESLWDDL